MIGDVIIEAVVRADALQDAKLTEGGVVFVWRANAAEQIEGALAPAIHYWIANKSQDKELLDEFAFLLKVGSDRKDELYEILKNAIASFLFSALEIEIPTT